MSKKVNNISVGCNKCHVLKGQMEIFICYKCHLSISAFFHQSLSSISTYMQQSIHINHYPCSPLIFQITSVCIAISEQMVPVHLVISMNLLPRCDLIRQVSHLTQVKGRKVDSCFLTVIEIQSSLFFIFSVYCLGSGISLVLQKDLPRVGGAQGGAQGHAVSYLQKKGEIKVRQFMVVII